MLIRVKIKKKYKTINCKAYVTNDIISVRLMKIKL